MSVGLWASVSVLSGNGGECSVAWPACVLDQWSWRAVDIWGGFHYILEVEKELGTNLLSFGVERVPGLRAVI